MIEGSKLFTGPIPESIQRFYSFLSSVKRLWIINLLHSWMNRQAYEALLCLLAKVLKDGIIHRL